MQGLFAVFHVGVVAALEVSPQLMLRLLTVVILCIALTAIILIGRHQEATAPPTGSTALLGAARPVYEQLVSAGQMVPLPEVVPMGSRAVQTSGRVPLVVDRARQLREIPWGVAPTVRADELRPLFDSTLGQVFGVRADFSQYEKLIPVFASMPPPFCYVGAAEIMRRLSFLSGTTYIPEGLLQALLFAVQAQCASPLQPDALVAQARILSSSRHLEWDRLALSTFATLDRVAPHHPRLATARATYFYIRARFDEALAWCSAAVTQVPTDPERADAYKQMADILRGMKRYPEALQAYDMSLGADPLNEWAWHNKSLALLDVGRTEEAYMCNQRALSLQQFGAAFDVRKRILASFKVRHEQPPESVSWL